MVVLALLDPGAPVVALRRVHGPEPVEVEQEHRRAAPADDPSRAGPGA